MSQPIDISTQSNLVLENLGAATKSKAQLIADYPDAKQGQWVLSKNEAYQCMGNGEWNIFRDLPADIAFTNKDNEFSTTQSIESGGIKTEAPIGGTRAVLKTGKIAISGTPLVVDETKYIEAEVGGSVVKIALVVEQGVTYYQHDLTFAGTSGAACVHDNPTAVYSDSNSLTTGVKLYTTNSLTTAVAAGFYSNGNAWFQVVADGTITATDECGTNTFNNTNGPGTFVYDENGSGQNRTLFFGGSLPGSSLGANPVDTSVTTSIQREMNGTSSASELSITISAGGGNITLFSNMEITDGINDYQAVITGNGTANVALTFSIGGQKGRTFNWKGSVNNEITIQPAN